jgi:hypothetical protein
MAEERQTKTCKVCYEQIDQRARKCPHCRQGQHPLTVITFHPAVVMWLFAMPVLAVCGLAIYMFSTAMSPSEYFAKHEGQIRVLRSEMLWEEQGTTPIVAVVGEIENDSSLPWQWIEIEVQFWDSAGRLVDAFSDLHWATVLEHARSDFRVASSAYLPRESYAEYKASIRSARDARDRW